MTRFNFSRERGAVLIHVAVAMLGLLAFSALVIDYGIFWVSRRQAQNAADAGGAGRRDGAGVRRPERLLPTRARPSVGERTRSSALANQRRLGSGADVDITHGHHVSALPPDDGADTCVRVIVYRDVGASNPLPTFFARLVGVTTQDIKATATAKVLTGNATECMRPFADHRQVGRWTTSRRHGDDYRRMSTTGDVDTTGTLNSTFDNYDARATIHGQRPVRTATRSCDTGRIRPTAIVGHRVQALR